MSFTIFEQSTTALATEVNDNFYHIAQGDLLPRDGVSLTAIDATYDLGSDSYRWNNVFLNELNIYNSINSYGNLWTVISEETLSATSATIQIVSSFNGDLYEDIRIMCFAELTGGTMHYSPDTATGHGYQSLYVRKTGVSVTTTASRLTGWSSILLSQSFTITTNYCMIEMNMNTKTGKQRMIDNRFVTYVNSNTIYDFGCVAGTFTDMNTTITSISISRGSVAGTSGVYFQPGSRYIMWGRR